MALSHQEPDRVPLASFTMVDVSYHALRRYLGLEPVQPLYLPIEDLAPGGGFMLTPRGPVRPEVPPENICAIYEAVQQYGKY